MKSKMASLKVLLDELCELAAKAEGYWYALASDYQSKYAFTSDYDKSYKRSYYEKAEHSRQVAETLKQIALPTDPQEVPACVEKIELLVRSFPRLTILERSMQEYLDRMKALAEAAANSAVMSDEPDKTDV